MKERYFDLKADQARLVASKARRFIREVDQITTPAPAALEEVAAEFDRTGTRSEERLKNEVPMKLDERLNRCRQARKLNEEVYSAMASLLVCQARAVLPRMWAEPLPEIVDAPDSCPGSHEGKLA
jgi:hypothetical protein